MNNNNFIDLIIAAKIHAHKFRNIDSIDISTLYLKIFYQRNHKYLIESKNFNINEIIQKSFNSNEQEFIYKSINDETNISS
ncbi:hypothetical protein ACYATP_08165 [Lactobacillaceae bacterium Melli_B4]